MACFVFSIFAPIKAMHLSWHTLSLSLLLCPSLCWRRTPRPRTCVEIFLWFLNSSVTPLSHLLVTSVDLRTSFSAIVALVVVTTPSFALIFFFSVFQRRFLSFVHPPQQECGWIVMESATHNIQSHFNFNRQIYSTCSTASLLLEVNRATSPSLYRPLCLDFLFPSPDGQTKRKTETSLKRKSQRFVKEKQKQKCFRFVP